MQKPRILGSNIWYKHNKRSPPFFLAKLNVIMRKFLIHTIYLSHILLLYFKIDGSGISTSFFHFVNRVLMYQPGGQVGNVRLELQRYCHSS